jgi:hypothetical protein
MLFSEESGPTARFQHIFARLQELPNYVWDPDTQPFHSVSPQQQSIA